LSSWFSLAHKIIAGRHLTVEGGLEEKGRTFTTNDCFVGDQGRMWFITGFVLFFCLLVLLFCL
jgi:DNA mismatch repair ATPase MutS